MLILEYRKYGYDGCNMAIQPVNEAEIPELRDTVMNSLVIENPTKTFARKMTSGGYAGEPEELVVVDAEFRNIVSDLWRDKPDENVMVLLSRALQMIVDMKREQQGQW